MSLGPLQREVVPGRGTFKENTAGRFLYASQKETQKKSLLLFIWSFQDPEPWKIILIVK